MFYGICLEEHTCEAILLHINENVVRKWHYRGATAAYPAYCDSGWLPAVVWTCEKGMYL